MTKNRDFKTLVRQRMAKTGERYSTARAHVVASGGTRIVSSGNGSAPTDVGIAGLLAGIRSVGGHQADLAAARNLCVNAGLTGPNDQPLSEAMAFGLAGGVGFLYGVFEYGDTPTMTIVARNHSMPDPFLQALFDRLGVETSTTETTGAKKAATALDQALADGRPALCTVGAGGLPYHGLPDDESGMSPHVVGVIGAAPDTGLLWLDDRSPNPLPVERHAFDAARAAYRAGKHRMVVIDSVPDDVDWPAVITAAVAAAVDGFTTPPVPQFRSNVGIAGLTKWSELLTTGAKKGWPSIFGSGRRAAIGLSRLYECVNHAYTAADAGRPLFADFLDEAAAVTGNTEWRDVAAQWRNAGEHWREISNLATGAHPDIERFAELADGRAQLLDGAGTEATESIATTMRSLHDEQRGIVESCTITAAAAADTYRSMAECVAAIIEIESKALAALR